MWTNLLKETKKAVKIKNEIKRKSKIKNYIKILFLFLTFISIMFWIYKNPKLIFEKDTQNNIIETVEGIDTQIDNIN